MKTWQVVTTSLGLLAAAEIQAGGFAAPIVTQASNLAPIPVVTTTINSVSKTEAPRELSVEVDKSLPVVTGPVPSEPVVVTGPRIIATANGQKTLEVPVSVTFPSNESALAPDYAALAKQLAAVIAADPSVRVVVTGHADSTASAAYNMKLSLSRAATVAKALVDNGLKPDSVVVAGKGESQPVASNETPAGRAQNRRVEFSLEPR